MAVLCGLVWGYTIFKTLHMGNPQNLTGVLPQAPRNTKASPKAGVFDAPKGKMVGDPGIEPGMSRLGGVTVRCHTL